MKFIQEIPLLPLIPPGLPNVLQDYRSRVLFIYFCGRNSARPLAGPWVHLQQSIPMSGYKRPLNSHCLVRLEMSPFQRGQCLLGDLVAFSL